MAYAGSTLDLDAVPDVLRAMATWEPTYGCSSGLHAGDVGWQLAWPDAQCLPAVHLWRGEDGRLAAVGIEDGPGEWRLRPAPALVQDPGLTGALVADLDRLLGEGAASIELPTGPTLLAARLVGDGFSAADASWPVLFRSLDRPPMLPDGVGPIRVEEFDARAVVQASAFAPYSGPQVPVVERWPLLHARPGFDAGLDLVARTPDGRVVAGATGWSAGPGRCGLLEPVATHAEHQGHGYGRRVVEGACAVLAERGASGVRVHTPGFNVAAVQTYLACGFAVIERTAPLIRAGR